MNFILHAKQPPPRSVRKKELSKLLMARTDIIAAMNSAELMLERVTSISDDLYYSIFTATIVCYARPFTNNKPYGSLPKRYGKFKNDLQTRTHQEIMSARHELIAHSDMTVRRAKIVPKGAVIGDLNGKDLRSAGIGTKTNFFFSQLKCLRM